MNIPFTGEKNKTRNLEDLQCEGIVGIARLWNKLLKETATSASPDPREVFIFPICMPQSPKFISLYPLYLLGDFDKPLEY